MVGWRVAFLVVGGLGIVWIVPWLILNRARPESHPWLTDEERNHILQGDRSGLAGIPGDEDRILAWRELLGYRQSWSVIASRFFLDPIWWLFVNWLPIYLTEQFGFDIKQIGLFAWVPYVGAAAGSLAGGWFSGYLIRRGWSVDRARKRAIYLGGIIMLPAAVISAFAGTPLVAVLLIAVILFGFQVCINNIQTLPSDFFSGKSVGTLAGLGGTSATLGVLITIWLVPRLTVVSYVPFFLMAALLVPAGILSIYVLAGRIERVRLMHGSSE